MKTVLRFLVAASLLLFPVAASAQVLVPTDPSLSPLAIKSQRVSVELKDQLARTHIEQVFVSHADRPLEATYVFPIPDGVAIGEFAMWMNGKKVTGEVLEADKARAIYESIVARVRDPGLLEYAGQRLLRCRVFPIPPRGEQKIEIEYGEVTKIEGGVGRYTYPLATGGKSTRLKDDLSLRVRLTSKVAIKTVYSPTHKVSVDRKGDHEALVGFEEKGASLDRDFDLFYAVSEKDVGLNLITFRERKSEDGYFVVMIAPKAEVDASEVLPKDVVFVIDSSGSMDGGKMAKAKEALAYIVGTLREKDRFNIVRFSTGVESYASGLVPADKGEIERAKKFVSGIEAAGGTAIDDALAEALKSINPEKGRPAMVVFFTDGEPTIGETDPNAILANVTKRKKAGVRIFSFGVGTELNAVLLDQLAGQNGGAPEYATADEEIEAKVSTFAAKINSPVMTDVAVDFGKAQVYDVYPKTVPDLFKGGQLTMFGRYKGTGGATAVTLSGQLQGRKQSLVYEGKLASDASDEDDAGAFIPRLWGTRKVGYLLDEIRLKGEKPELRDEVVSLARKFGIMTPYTSYLVVEDGEIVASGMPRPAPVMAAPPRDEMRREERDGRFAGARAEAPRPQRPSATRSPGKKAAESASGGMGGASASSAPATADSSSGGDDFGGGYYEPQQESVATRTGAEGVAVSKTVKDKREKEVLDRDDRSNVTRAGGHTYLWIDEAWVDADYKGTEKVLKVKYLSEAWFTLVRVKPELRDALSVGDRVIVVVARGKAVVVSADGADKLSEAEIRAFLK